MTGVPAMTTRRTTTVARDDDDDGTAGPLITAGVRASAVALCGPRPRSGVRRAGPNAD